MSELMRAEPRDEAALLASGWSQVMPWLWTCSGVRWAWFARRVG